MGLKAFYIFGIAFVLLGTSAVFAEDGDDHSLDAAAQAANENITKASDNFSSGVGQSTNDFYKNLGNNQVANPSNDLLNNSGLNGSNPNDNSSGPNGDGSGGGGGFGSGDGSSGDGSGGPPKKSPIESLIGATKIDRDPEVQEARVIGRGLSAHIPPPTHPNHPGPPIEQQIIGYRPPIGGSAARNAVAYSMGAETLPPDERLPTLPGSPYNAPYNYNK